MSQVTPQLDPSKIAGVHQSFQGKWEFHGPIQLYYSACFIFLRETLGRKVGPDEHDSRMGISRVLICFWPQNVK